MKYFILTNFNLDLDIKGHAILLEDIKRGHSARQIHFTSVPFIIMFTKRLDCAHGVDLCVSSKKKKRKTKLSRWKRLVFVRWCHKIIEKLKNLDYNVIDKSKSFIKGPIFEMKLKRLAEILIPDCGQFLPWNSRSSGIKRDIMWNRGVSTVAN